MDLKLQSAVEQNSLTTPDISKIESAAVASAVDDEEETVESPIQGTRRLILIFGLGLCVFMSALDSTSKSFSRSFDAPVFWMVDDGGCCQLL